MSGLSRLAELSLESGLGSDNYFLGLSLCPSLSPALEGSVGEEFKVEPPLALGQTQVLKFGGWVVMLVSFALEPFEA